MTTITTFTDAATKQLAQAAKDGDEALIRELVAGGANPNAQGEDGITLLQWTMLNQSRRGFEALLDAGADPTRGDKDGMTAMNLAAKFDTPYYLESLLKRKFSPDTPNTVTAETPLMSALMTERSKNIDLLLESGVQLNAADRQQETALHVAASINQPDNVLKLLEAGADPNARNNLGVTFQRYLFATKDERRSAEVRRQRDAVREWLRGHGVPVEDAASQ